MRACCLLEPEHIIRRKYGPSFQHVRSPIHFCRVRTVSILSGDNEERWRACSLGHSEVAVEGLLHRPADPAGVAGTVAAVLVVVALVAVGCSIAEFV